MCTSHPNPDICKLPNVTYTSTGETHVAEGLRLRFLERIDLHDERPEEDIEQTVSGLGGSCEDYGPIKAPSQKGPARQKWIYVFERGLDGHVGLSAEGQFDQNGTLELVDWQSKSWANQDRRPTTEEKEAEDPAHLRVDYDPEASELFAFLLHTQLPWHRLQQYLGHNPEVRLEQRAVKIAPKDNHLVGRNDEAGVDCVLLTDYVDHVDRLHRKYTAAIREKEAYLQEKADKMLHASLTRSIVDEYTDQQAGEDVPPDTPKVEVPGNPMNRLSDFQAEVDAKTQALDEEITLWADWLYDAWLGSPMYEIAQADGVMYAAAPSNFNKTQVKRAETELLRDLELLDEAVRSDQGKQYLEDRFGDGLKGMDRSAAKGMAFASKFLQKLVEVGRGPLSDLYTKAKQSTLSALSMPQRRLRGFSIVVEQLEMIRMDPETGTRLRKKYTKVQIGILDQLVEAVGADPSSMDQPAKNPAPVWQADPSAPDAHPSTDAQPSSALVKRGDNDALRFSTVDTDGTISVLRGTAKEGRVAVEGDRFRGSIRATEFSAEGKSTTGSPNAVTETAEVKRRKIVLSLVDTGNLDADASGQAGGGNGDVINGSGRLLVALGVLDVGLGFAEIPALVGKSLEDDPTHSVWDTVLASGGKVTGLGGAALGTYEAMQNLWEMKKFSKWLGKKAAGRIAIVLDIVASASSTAQELKQGDTYGAISAASGGAGAVAFAGAMGGGMLGLSAFVLSGAGLGLLIIAGVAWYLSDTKLESWLRHNYWSEEGGYIQGGAEGRGKTGEKLEEVLAQQIQELMKMLSKPQVEVYILSPPSSDGSQVRYDFGEHSDRIEESRNPMPKYWENLPEGTELRLEVTPGFFQPRMNYIDISGLTIKDWLASEAFVDGERLLMGDAKYDAILRYDNGQTGFARSWDLSGEKVRLEAGQARIDVDMSVTVRYMSERKWGFEEGALDQEWTVTGRGGHDEWEGKLDVSAPGWF